MAPKKVTPRGKAAQPPKASAAKKPAAKKAAPKKRGSTQRFIRAIYSPAGGTRLTLNNGNRFLLQPRGQVGDLAPVTKDDRDDPIYIQNLAVMFEEISAAEAKKIIASQNINAQPNRPRTIDYIKDEYGNPVNQNVKVEKPFEQQGQVVAHIEDGPEGRFTDGHQGRITRAPGEAPQQVAVPGSQQNPGPQVPSNIPPEQAADWLARNATNQEGAADALRSALNVEVSPTQKDITP